MAEDSERTLLHMEATGSLIDLCGDSIADIHLEDIAHNLSRVPRFCGNTCRPYSVAEHSIMVFQMVEEWGATPHVCMQALMHDATEAYIGDIPGPLKTVVPQIREFERKELWPRIARKFMLPLDLDPVIKKADWVAFYVEAASLCKSANLREWEDWEEYRRSARSWMEKYGELDDKTMLHPEAIEKVFIDLFGILFEARRNMHAITPESKKRA